MKRGPHLLLRLAFLLFIGLSPSAEWAQKKIAVDGQKTKPKCQFRPTITLKNIIDVEIEASPAAQKYGVDPALLLALFWHESKWDPEVPGCSGEQGLGQFMPKTAQSLGIQDVHDIRETSEKGAKQLRYLLNKYAKFSDPVDLALAAWNVGEPEVDSCRHTNSYTGIAYQGKAPCVPPDEWHRAADPKKVTNAPTTYVRSINSYLSITRKLVDYLATAKDPGKASETARLRADLESAVQQIAQKDHEISDLNIRVTDLTEQVETLRAELERAPSPEVAREAQQRVLEAQREYAQLRARIDELNQTDPATANEVTLLRGRLESANNEIEDLQRQLAQKDTIIVAQKQVIVDQRTSIAALQKQVDELRNSSNPEDRSGAQIQELRDEIAAQNVKIKDLGDPLLKKELENQLASMSGELDLVCGTFAECMSRGQRAYHSNDFSAALGFFRQAAIINPESPLSWHWVGHTSMAAGRTEEAFAAWDRILTLQGGVPLPACEEVGQPMCEGGTLTLSSGTLARYKGDNKIFEVPLNSVRILNAANHRSGSHITFDVEINGISHVFDFFPMGFNCPWKSSVNCPAGGQDVQVKIGEYAAQSIRRLSQNPQGFLPSTAPPAGINVLPAESTSEAKFYAVQRVIGSGVEKVKICPGSQTSNAVLIERLDGAIVQKTAYDEITGLDLNRKRVRISIPGQILLIPLPGASMSKINQLCIKTSSVDKKRPLCFVSDSATCNQGDYCREGSDGGSTIEQLADDLRSHLSRH